MNKIKLTTLLQVFNFFLSFYFISANAQDTTSTIGRVPIASPTAASLGKYGDIPVSYRTGIPNISIPIYTVESGSLKLPISLSYHAGGLKVQEPAGWVGANWALNAGGMITRTVVGAPDDKGNNVGGVVTHGHYTDYGFNSYLNGTGTTTPDDIAFARGYKDGEPDLYFFNFAGYTGKFYFNDDRTPILMPEQDFRIQTFYQAGSGFQGFIVTTPDGTKYYFGQTGNNGTVNPIETTIPSTLQNGLSTATAAASSWFLNKIISGDGMDSITLNYASESYSYYTASMFPVLSTNFHPTSGNPQQMGFDVAKNFVSGVRLTQISFANGTVTFTQSASARTDLTGGSSANNGLTDVANTSSFSLGSINISNNQGFCKKDSFYYGYFYDATGLNSSLSFYSSYNIHSDQYRLRLDSIQETACDGSIKVPPYKFSYFTDGVPRRLSFGIDHWGFYNGGNGNTTLVPTFNVITQGSGQSTPGGNRDASWPAMRGGTLQQISYPTGSSTSFDFEPKAVYSYNSTIYDQVIIGSYALNYGGQGQTTQTQNFSVVGDGAVSVSVTNTSTNYQPTFTLKNSSNQTIYYSGFISTTFNMNFNLAPGNYSATLAFDIAGGPIVGGAYGSIKQWRYVPYTNTQTVGGLRIKTITNKDGLTANDVITSYSYLDQSSLTNDVLYSVPVYVQIIRNDLLGLVWIGCSPNGCASCDGFNAHTYYVSPGSIRPMANVQGENVGYNEVDVSQTGNGRSVYQYYGGNSGSLTDVCVRSITQSSDCDPSIPNFPFPPVAFDPMRNELKYEGHYNEAGQVLRESTYLPVYVADPLQTPGHISVDLPGMYSYTEYNLQSFAKKQNQVLQAAYDWSTGTANAITTTNTVYYGSSFHHQPTRSVSTMSTGDSLATNTKYALDFRITSCDAIPDSLPYYNTTIQNNYNWLYDSLAKCTPQTSGANNCRIDIFARFREKMMQARQKFITYRRRSYSDPGSLLSTCYLNALPGADTLLKPILRLQNMFNNAPIEASEWKNTNLRSANFTRYDTSTNPIGFAYPGRTKLISLQTPSSTFTSASVSGNTIAKDSRYIDESFYKFSVARPQQVTPHNGVVNSYIWDYLNTQPIAKVSNAANDQIAYTSFEANGNGNWTVGSALRDTGSVTGRKSYKLSNGSISKSGLTTAQYYTISYWTKNASAYTIAGTVGGYPVAGKTIGLWTYYEHVITGQTSVTLSGSGNIDELRLYPANAEMISYTYDPLVGMTSACDLNNRVTYYEYDKLGRLNVVRDQDHNIIKTTEYKYTGQTIP